MKSFFVLCAVCLLLLFVTPVCSLDFSNFSAENIKTALPFFKEDVKSVAALQDAPAGLIGNAHDNDAQKKDVVRVLDVSSDKVLEVELLDYIMGCVAGEMPISYAEEALKAQAVAAYTNLLRLQQKNADSKEKDAPDITSDTKKHQAYLSVEKRKALWGDAYEKNTKKLEKAVHAVLYSYLAYENEPISATFFSLSNGRTAKSASIWGGDVPYLISVSCPGDRLSTDLESQVFFSFAELRERLEKANFALPEEPKEWLQKVQYDDQNKDVVCSVRVGEKTISGNELRTILGLKSPAFQFAIVEDGFQFQVEGHGHLVGMSQNSANVLAQQGSTYIEILAHFYPGAVLTDAQALL